MEKEGDMRFALIKKTGTEYTPEGNINTYTLVGNDPELVDKGDAFLRANGAIPGESPMSKVLERAKSVGMPGKNGWRASWEPTGPQNAPHKEKLTPPPDPRWN